jgi:hypothetical protein
MAGLWILYACLVEAVKPDEVDARLDACAYPSSVFAGKLGTKPHSG